MNSDQPWLQSPLLTQIAVKGSGACARSLQARFMRFQGSPPPRPKFAAKNGTPLWQGGVLLVLAGGQGTSRALPPGGSDRSPKRGGGTVDVSPSQQPKDDPTHPPHEGGRAAGSAAGQPRVPEHPHGSEKGLSCPGFILDQPRWLEKKTSRLSGTQAWLLPVFSKPFGCSNKTHRISRWHRHLCS